MAIKKHGQSSKFYEQNEVSSRGQRAGTRGTGTTVVTESAESAHISVEVRRSILAVNVLAVKF